jgi:hypothetical protein
MRQIKFGWILRCRLFRGDVPCVCVTFNLFFAFIFAFIYSMCFTPPLP